MFKPVLMCFALTCYMLSKRHQDTLLFTYTQTQCNHKLLRDCLSDWCVGPCLHLYLEYFRSTPSHSHHLAVQDFRNVAESVNFTLQSCIQNIVLRGSFCLKGLLFTIICPTAVSSTSVQNSGPRQKIILNLTEPKNKILHYIYSTEML